MCEYNKLLIVVKHSLMYIYTICDHLFDRKLIETIVCIELVVIIPPGCTWIRSGHMFADQSNYFCRFKKRCENVMPSLRLLLELISIILILLKILHLI